MIKRSFFVKWYQKYGRDFPWRNDRTTPYQFLVTEVLLQQTKADDVAKIWNDFFGKYPDVYALSKADVTKLKGQIEFLGFGNKRANALKIIASWLVEKDGGIVPNDLKSLTAIPYVGSYAGSAVLCFAFNCKIEIVDANVIRLFNRYYGMQLNKDARRAPRSWVIAREMLPREKRKAKAHNYGLLDFTGQICKPIIPLCGICPLIKECQFGQSKITFKNTIPNLSC